MFVLPSFFLQCLTQHTWKMCWAFFFLFLSKPGPSTLPVFDLADCQRFVMVLNSCICLCVCASPFVCVNVCAYPWPCVNVCLRFFVPVSVCVFQCCICGCVWVCVCARMSMSLCVFVYCVCVCAMSWDALPL